MIRLLAHDSPDECELDLRLLLEVLEQYEFGEDERDDEVEHGDDDGRGVLHQEAHQHVLTRVLSRLFELYVACIQFIHNI